LTYVIDELGKGGDEEEEKKKFFLKRERSKK